MGYLQTIYFKQKSILPCKKVVSKGLKLYISLLILKEARCDTNIAPLYITVKKNVSLKISET